MYKEIFDLRQNGSHEDIEVKTAKTLEKKLSKTKDDLLEASDIIIILESNVWKNALQDLFLLKKFELRKHLQNHVKNEEVEVTVV